MDYSKRTSGDVTKYIQNDEEILSISEGGEIGEPVLLGFDGTMKSSFAPDIKADLNQYVSMNCPIILDFTKLKGISISCINAILDTQIDIDRKIGKAEEAEKNRKIKRKELEVIRRNSITIQNVPADILSQFKKIGLTELVDIR